MQTPREKQPQKRSPSQGILMNTVKGVPSYLLVTTKSLKCLQIVLSVSKNSGYQSSAPSLFLRMRMKERTVFLTSHAFIFTVSPYLEQSFPVTFATTDPCALMEQ